MQNNKFNELNLFHVSSQNPNEQITVQNSNFDGGPNISFKTFIPNVQGAEFNDGLSGVLNRSHSNIWIPQMPKHTKEGVGRGNIKEKCFFAKTVLFVVSHRGDKTKQKI